MSAGEINGLSDPFSVKMCRSITSLLLAAQKECQGKNGHGDQIKSPCSPSSFCQVRIEGRMPKRICTAAVLTEFAWDRRTQA